jgi:chaperonin GroEL
MPKMLLYGEQARVALARGVEKLAKAIETALGPRGGNAVIDRPQGTPLVSRNGVSIADEIELEDRFENMGAQIAREVAKQTNKVAGDGTTTAVVLANAKTELEFVDGISFDRGYRSAHMANEIERMEAVLESALVFLTDHPLVDSEKVEIIKNISTGAGRPVLLIAEEISAEALATMLALRNSGSPLMVAVHPPEFGHWRKAVLADLAILTGGRFVSKDLGARLEDLRLEDFGTARKVRVSLETTTIIGEINIVETQASREFPNSFNRCLA